MTRLRSWIGTRLWGPSWVVGSAREMRRVDTSPLAASVNRNSPDHRAVETEVPGHARSWSQLRVPLRSTN